MSEHFAAMERDNFADKLQLLLKVLVLSRTGLASALNIDKSLVSRWVSGAVKPSEHNLAKLTRFIATKVPRFTVLDWERDIGDFRQLLGLGAQPTLPDASQWVPKSLLEETKGNVDRRGAVYAGLWRSTRASHDMPGRFIHDIILVTKGDDGTMRFKLGVEGVRYEGWSLMLQHQMFSCAFDLDIGTVLFSIFNGVARQKPQVLDGINLTTLRDAGGSPVASASVLERLAEASGDQAQDEQMFEEAVAALNPLAPEGSISEEIATHLTRNLHGEADGIIRLLFSQSMARGNIISELAR